MKQRRSRPIRLSLSLFAAFAAAYGGQAVAAMSSAGYAIERDVIASGGKIASTSYILSAAAGQPSATGASASANYALRGGFYVLADVDVDGVYENTDNCLLVANTTQRDTNGDGFGNACDADLNGDLFVNTLDFGLFRQAYGKTGPALDADFNGDGIVNTLDFGRFRQMYGKPPGPSAQAP